MSRRNPEFGSEVRRTFEVHERCFDCLALYAGCAAWPANEAFACGDFSPLPDVGVDGRTGQEFPAARKTGRKPRAIRCQARSRTAPRQTRTIEAAAPAKLQDPPADERPPGDARTPSPAARYGPDGERLCECGATLKRRQRCCTACRQKRRQATMRRRRSRGPAAVAV